MQDETSRNAVAGNTILLVEDNATDVFVIRKVLLEAGVDLNVHVARDGQEALDYLLGKQRDEPASRPKLVLLDLNIPKVSGLEILRELRQSAQHQSVPVIVVTSSGAESDRAAAGALRIEGYFKKPTSMTKYRELSSLVKSVLQSAGQQPTD